MRNISLVKNIFNAKSNKPIKEVLSDDSEYRDSESQDIDVKSDNLIENKKHLDNIVIQDGDSNSVNEEVSEDDEFHECEDNEIDNENINANNTNNNQSQGPAPHLINYTSLNILEITNSDTSNPQNSNPAPINIIKSKSNSNSNIHSLVNDPKVPLVMPACGEGGFLNNPHNSQPEIAVKYVSEKNLDYTTHVIEAAEKMVNSKSFAKPTKVGQNSTGSGGAHLQHSHQTTSTTGGNSLNMAGTISSKAKFNEKRAPVLKKEKSLKILKDDKDHKDHNKDKEKAQVP